MRVPALDDAGPVAAVMASTDLEVGYPPDTDATKVAWAWRGPDVDLDSNFRVITDENGTIVGYIEFEALEPWTQLGFDGYVAPDHTGRGIGTAIVDWAKARARTVAEQAPPAERVVLRHFQWAIATQARAFMEASGFQVCRWFYNMLIELDHPIPEPGPIEGITFRPMEDGQERDLWQADDEAFSDHWGYVTEPYEEWLHHHVQRPEFERDLVILAMDGEEMAGYSVNYPTRTEDPKKAWVSILGVRRGWRRRGIGQALLGHSFRALANRGCERVGLGVDAENPLGAVALYEKAGMHVDREAVSYELEIRPAGAD